MSSEPFDDILNTGALDDEDDFGAVSGPLSIADLPGLDGDDIDWDEGDGLSMDDDEFGLDDEDDEGDEGDDEGNDEPVEVASHSRIAMADRLRRSWQGRFTPDESEDIAYAKGVRDALAAVGIRAETVEETYGTLLGSAGRKISGLGSGFLQGVMGDVSAPELFRRLGQGVREGLVPPKPKSRANAGAEAQEEVSEDVAVEADAETLSPVYVADEEAADEGLDQAEEAFGAADDGHYLGPLEAASEFGETAKYGGFLDRRRESTRRAALRAAGVGSKAMRRAPRGRELPFIEDVAAEPVLLSDGRVVEPVYGAMTVVPCPSCAHVEQAAVRRGDADSCLVCNRTGAILIPEGDVEHFGAISAVLMGVLKAAASIATSIAGSVVSKKIAKGKGGESREFLARMRAKKTKKDDLFQRDDGDDETVSGLDVRRAILPAGWLKARGL